MRITVVRGSSESPERLYEQTFELPDLKGASVSNALQYINRHTDGSIAYYLSCRRGLCACCVVRINGKIEKACVVDAKDGMVIGPIRIDLLIKDTVVHLGMPKEAAFEVENTTWMVPEMGLAKIKSGSPGESQCD